MVLSTLLGGLQVLVSVEPLDTMFVYISAACANSVGVSPAKFLPIPKRPLIELAYGTCISKSPVWLWRRSSIVAHMPGDFGNLGRWVQGQQAHEKGVHSHTHTPTHAHTHTLRMCDGLSCPPRYILQCIYIASRVTSCPHG